MGKIVETPEGNFEYPDSWSDDRILEHANANLSKGRVASGFDSMRQAAVEGVGKTLEGAGRFSQIAPTWLKYGFDPRLMGEKTREDIRREGETGPEIQARIEADPITQAGEEVSETARDAFTPNPRYSGEFWSEQVPSGLGSVFGLAPAVAAGPAAPLVAGAMYGMQAGETMAEEAGDILDRRIADARAKGDFPAANTLEIEKVGIQNQSFLIGTAIGGSTEALLGPIGRIPRALGGKAMGRFTGRLVERLGPKALRTGVEGSVREASQEGLEQLAQNITARIMYDPERGLMDGVGRSALVGGVVGGGVGGIAGGLARKPRTIADDVEDALGGEAPPGTETPPPGGGTGAGTETPPGAPGADPLAGLPVATPGTTEADPIPESPAALAEQLRLTADPKSSKAATLITPGEETPEVPDTLASVETPHGLVIFNPNKIHPDEVRYAGSGETFDATILGMGSGANPTPSRLVVTTSTDSAKNVITEVVPETQEGISRAAEAQGKAVPGGVTELKPAVEVARERQEETEGALGTTLRSKGVSEDSAKMFLRSKRTLSRLGVSDVQLDEEHTTSVSVGVNPDGTLRLVVNPSRLSKHGREEMGLALDEEERHAAALAYLVDQLKTEKFSGDFEEEIDKRLEGIFNSLTDGARKRIMGGMGTVYGEPLSKAGYIIELISIYGQAENLGTITQAFSNPVAASKFLGAVDGFYRWLKNFFRGTDIPASLRDLYEGAENLLRNARSQTETTTTQPQDAQNQITPVEEAASEEITTQETADVLVPSEGREAQAGLTWKLDGTLRHDPDTDSWTFTDANGETNTYKSRDEALAAIHEGSAGYHTSVRQKSPTRYDVFFAESGSDEDTELIHELIPLEQKEKPAAVGPTSTPNAQEEETKEQEEDVLAEAIPPETAPQADIWNPNISDEDLEEILSAPPRGGPLEFTGRSVRYTFRDAAEFVAWMDARFAENDLEGMAAGYADAPAPLKVAYIKANRGGNQTKQGVITHLATGAPLPAGWTATKRTTPRPPPVSMSGGFRPTPKPAPPQPRPQPTGQRPPPGPSPPPRGTSQHAKFNTTALVQLLRLFGKYPRINRLLRKAYGQFSQRDQNIGLKERLFWDRDLANRVLAHEIGHFIDLAISIYGKGKQFAYRWQPIRQFQTALERKELREKAKALSRQWRGPFPNGDPYRDTGAELFADAISAILNDPEWVNTNHPEIHDTFRGLMDGKPDFRWAFLEINRWLRTGTVTEQTSEQLRRSMHESRKKLAEGDEAVRAGIWDLAKQMVVTPWFRAFDKEGRTKELGERVIDKLENNDTYAARQNALLRDDFLRRVQPELGKLPGGNEAARDMFGEYLIAQRIIGERRAAGLWIEQNPQDAAKLLDEIFKLDPALAGKWQGRLQALGANPTGTEIYDLSSAVFREMHDKGEKYVERMARAISRLNLGVNGDAALAAFNVRGKLLNPSGLTPETAAESIRRLDSGLTPPQRTALRAASSEFLKIAHEQMRVAHDIGIISDKVWNEIIVPNQANYVPFAVSDYWEGKVGAGIKEQWGTARDIIDPVVALQQKIASMHHWVQRQGQAVLLMEAYAKGGYPLPAPQRLEHLSDIDRIRREHRGDDTSRLVLWQDGQPHMVEFDVDAGKTFEAASERRLAHEEFARLYYQTGISGVSRSILGLYTVFNPAFVIFRNPIRDARTTAQRVGYRSVARSMSTRLPRLAINYARAAFGGQMDPEVRAMVEDGTLPPPQLATALAADPVMLEEMLVNGTIMAGDISMLGRRRTPGPIESTLAPAKQVWQTFAGAMEAMPKIMARDAALRGGNTPAFAAAIARRAGIPNPGIGGTWKSFLEAFFPWTRVHVQGMRTSLDVMRDPRLRNKFVARFAASELIPRLAKYAIASGAVAALMGLDDDDDSWLASLGEFFRRVSPYKLAIDNIIPLGWHDTQTGQFHSLFSTLGWKKRDIPHHWEAVSFRMPSSEEGKLWGSLVWNILSGMTPEKTSQRGQGSVANVGNWLTTQATTSFNPIGKVGAQQFSMLVLGRNPKDDFRGTEIANPDLFNAGWGAGREQAVFGALTKELGFLGDTAAFIGQSLGMDPRAFAPGKLLAIDKQMPLAKVPIAKSMLAFDNYQIYRERAVERADDEKFRARARNIMPSEVRQMYDYYYAHVRDHDKLDLRGKYLYDVSSRWHTHVWGNSEKPWSMSQKALHAVGPDGSSGAKETLKRDLGTVSLPYIHRFEAYKAGNVPK